MARYPQWIQWCVCTIHFIWAVLLILSADALGATPVGVLTVLVANRYLLAALLLVSSALASFGLSRVLGDSPRRLTLLLPQEGILLLSASGSLVAVLAGHYGDGVMRPPAFILADQFPVICLAIFHTIAILTEPLRGAPSDA